MFGLPAATVVALGLMIALPLLAYGLYRVDWTRGDGRVTILGRSSAEQ